MSQQIASPAPSAAEKNITDTMGQPIRLTSREMDVLTSASEGCTSQQIADQLFVSKRTVDFHLSNVYKKLKVNKRLKAYRRAVALGIIS